MKRFAALLLALMLLPAFASLAEVQKTELVYARLNALGELTGLYVVNAFEADADADHEDYGAYSELTQLSPGLPLEQQGEKLSLKLPKGRSYYQGKPAKQELPWTFSLGYSLDGHELAPAELSGATGRLEMRLNVQVKEAMAAHAQGITLQISLRLDGDRCLNIAAEQATIAQAGGDILLSFMVLPGQSAQYALSADVRDFSMEGLQISGVRLKMDPEQYKQAMLGSGEGNPMAQAIGPMIENFVKRLEGGQPASFVDDRNGGISGLQFIILGEGVPEKEQPAAADAAATKPQETLFTRLAALFQGK